MTLDKTYDKQEIATQAIDFVAYPSVISFSLDQLGFPNLGFFLPYTRIVLFDAYERLVQLLQQGFEVLLKDYQLNIWLQHLVPPTIHSLACFIFLVVFQVLQIVTSPVLLLILSFLTIGLGVYLLIQQRFSRSFFAPVSNIITISVALFVLTFLFLIKALSLVYIIVVGAFFYPYIRKLVLLKRSMSS